jgi:hypothetical protein
MMIRATVLVRRARNLSVILLSLATVNPSVASEPEKNDHPRASGTASPVATAPEPTRATAGADDCRVGEAVSLGGGGGPIVVAFDRTGGLAAWPETSTMLAVRPIAPDGSARGPVVRVAVGKEVEPHAMFATGHGFVLVMLRLDSQHGYRRWWGGRVFGRNGRPAGPATDLGLADMEVRVGQALDADRIGLIVAGANVAKRNTVGRWQTLVVGHDGGISSIPSVVAVDDLVTTTDDDWQPAVLAGQRGWVVLRRGLRRPEGIFDGVRRPAAAALPLVPPDGVSAEVVNLAEPPPPGPDGTIFEAMGRPALRRTRAGEAFGQLAQLLRHGNPVGSYGMNVESALFWSGTHFLYPFHEDKGAYLLPVDCRP